MTGHQRATLQAALDRWVVPLGGCLVWTGSAPKSRDGLVRHPHVHIGDRQYYVRRLVWERDHGPIPEGMAVRSTCGQDCCVAAEHLELGPRGRLAEDRGKHHIPRPEGLKPPARTCRECGGSFLPTGGNQQYCTRECRATRIRRVDRDRKQRERDGARDR